MGQYRHLAAGRFGRLGVHMLTLALQLAAGQPKGRPKYPRHRVADAVPIRIESRERLAGRLVRHLAAPR